MVLPTKQKCKASTASGGRCKNNALPGSDYCMVPSHAALAAGDEALAEEEERREAQEEFVPVEPEPTACGHVNVHAKPNLTCTLAPNHDGAHSCPYPKRDKAGNLLDANAFTFWTDEAGKPAEEFEPDLYSLPREDPRHPNYDQFMREQMRR